MLEFFLFIRIPRCPQLFHANKDHSFFVDVCQPLPLCRQLLPKSLRSLPPHFEFSTTYTCIFFQETSYHSSSRGTTRRTKVSQKETATMSSATHSNIAHAQRTLLVYPISGGSRWSWIHILPMMTPSPQVNHLALIMIWCYTQDKSRP